jgi:hypothetical protein
MDNYFGESEMRKMIRNLIPQFENSNLDLMTITAKRVDDSQVTLEFNFGVDGKWK